MEVSSAAVLDLDGMIMGVLVIEARTEDKGYAKNMLVGSPMIIG
jgi:hypothetical protein